MPLYESVLIARQDLSPAQVESLTGDTAGLIKNQGGTVTKTEQWGLRNLAYRIKKNRKGHYVLMNIDAPAPAIAEMERNLRINEDVLRYLTLRVDAHEEGPSAMLRKQDDEPREGQGGPGSRGGAGRPLRPRPQRSETEQKGD